MPLEKRPNAEPIRGYRLLEKLGAGGYGEVWKCEAPGGIHKAIKFVFGNLNSLDGDSKRAEEELRAVQHIKSIRHPFLLSMDRVECVQGELVIVTELADHNLFELAQRYQARGQSGIPRDELLGYLREAAEVLDLLNHKFDLQHLDVKPHNLFLVSNHVKVADFGLINSLHPTGSSPEIELTAGAYGAVTPLYAAPELFHGKLSRHSDQYSLAIAYQELLTGKLPYAGANARQLLLQHSQAEPDLAPLPEADRAAVARALAKRPEDRHASCLDFLRALQGTARTVEIASAGSDTDPDLATTPNPAAKTPAPPLPVPLPRAAEPSQAAPSVPPPVQRPAPVMPPGLLDGYRFLECTANSALLESWKVQPPAGPRKLLHLLYGLRSPEKQLKEAVQRLRSVHHPALLAPELARADKGRVLLLIDSYRETLRDRFRQCQARKQPGIPRGELVDYLRAAAEVLDYLYQQHGIQHLSLNPRNLVLDNGWLQIAEFGYAQLLWLPEGQDVARRNTRYAAPQLFNQQRPRGSDQYSLAVIYVEMLTGVHPFGGRGAPGSPSPDLARLPELDREVIARALDADPKQRWPSCTDLLLALEGTSSSVQAVQANASDSFAQLLVNTRDSQKVAVYTGMEPADLNQAIADLVTSAGGRPVPTAATPTLVSTDANTLQHTFVAGLPIGTARLKLEEYSHQIGAVMRRHDDHGCFLHLPLPATFWQSWLGRQPGLDIAIRVARVNPMSATPIEVTARIEARHCAGRQDVIAQTGSDLIDALRKHLLVNSEKRVQDRVLWPHALTVIPLQPDGEREEPIACRGKDISATGIGFYLPHELGTADVLIELPNALHPPAITIPATLVRARRCADGWYDVGAMFRVPAPRRSLAEVCA
jgi:serine/threonine protein kinase